MKKTFQLTHPKIARPRMVDAVKHEIRKYVKRERRRDLPEGADFWDFDCKFGITEADAKTVHLSELTSRIDQTEAEGQDTFYVEVIRKTGHRTKKPKEQDETDTANEDAKRHQQHAGSADDVHEGEITCAD